MRRVITPRAARKPTQPEQPVPTERRRARLRSVLHILSNGTRTSPVRLGRGHHTATLSHCCAGALVILRAFRDPSAQLVARAGQSTVIPVEGHQLLWHLAPTWRREAVLHRVFLE